MAVICPSIHETTLEKYRSRMEQVGHFAHRVQVDLTDGSFAKPKTIEAKEAWWPVGVKADIHLMFDSPAKAVKDIIGHKPNLIIVHAECRGNFTELAQLCRKYQVKVGVALLQQTSPLVIADALPQIDHVLIFSGDLGKDGGHANLALLEKVKMLKAAKHDLEVGWDGGINEHNIHQLVFGGVDVLNVGGYIHAAENPAKAYHHLVKLVTAGS